MYFSYFILGVYDTLAGPTHILLPRSLTMRTISAASSTTTLAGIWMPMNRQNLLTTKMLFLVWKKSTLHLPLFDRWLGRAGRVNRGGHSEGGVDHERCVMFGTI